MSSGSECLLIGGAHGGKSTFIGGLIYYLDEVSDLDWDPDYMYNEAEIRDKVYNTMKHDNEFPAKTENPYLLRLHIYRGGVLESETVFDIMDVPGEQLTPDPPPSTSLTNLLLKPITGYKTDKQKLIESYDMKIRPKLESGEPMPDTRMWRKLFQYRYHRSGSVICMLNLQKLLNESRKDPLIVRKTEQILDAARPKSRKLLLVTACDVIGYDPDQFEGGGSVLSGTVKDDNLATAIRNSISLERQRELRPVLRNILSSRSNFSYVGTSVKAADPDDYENKNLAGPVGKINLSGFDNVIEWLLA